MNFIIFLFLFLSIYGFINGYTLWSLFHTFTFTNNIFFFIWIAAIFGTLSFVVAEIISHKWNIHFLLMIAVYWMGWISISFSLALIKDFAVLFAPNKNVYLSVIVLILSILITLYASYKGAQPPIIKNIPLKLKDWPQELSNFKIVQLSDIHIDSFKSFSLLKQIVDQTNRLNPDLILLTGDILNKDVSDDSSIIQLFKNFHAKYGVFAITGNHEFYTGIDVFEFLCTQTGIQSIRNELINIANGQIQIIGIDDITGLQFEQDGPDWNKALKNYKKEKPAIILNHHPDNFDKATSHEIDLQLSGHTHAGQIPPMDLIVRLYFKYPWGLYKRQDSYIYTSCGTLTWGPPMRLFSQNEIVCFTIS